TRSRRAGSSLRKAAIGSCTFVMRLPRLQILPETNSLHASLTPGGLLSRTVLPRALPSVHLEEALSSRKHAPPHALFGTPNPAVAGTIEGGAPTMRLPGLFRPSLLWQGIAVATLA